MNILETNEKQCVSKKDLANKYKREKKNQMDILELRNTTTEIKISIDGSTIEWI